MPNPTATSLVEGAIPAIVQQKLAAGGTTFTTEDLRQVLGGAVDALSYGGIMGGLSRKGFVRRVGESTNSTVPESKGRLLYRYELTPAGFQRYGVAVPAPATLTIPAPAEFKALIADLQGYCAANGFIFDQNTIANFFLACRAKPFAFVHGPSGTGKSQLPQLVAEALGATPEVIPVQPNWADSTDLTGYYSVTKGAFVPGRLLRMLDAAIDAPERLHVVVLDEMNLARVEYYLAEYLSLMERRRREPDGVRTPPVPIEQVPPEGISTEASEEYERLSLLYLPANLLIVGTINVDETTFAFSPKVLNRAAAIEIGPGPLNSFSPPGSLAPVNAAGRFFLFDPPSKSDVPINVTEARKGLDSDPSRNDVWTRTLQELTAIDAALTPAGFPITYRTRDLVCLYMDGWHRLEAASIIKIDRAIELCVLQFILPSLRGTHPSKFDAVKGLWQWATGQPWPTDDNFTVPPGAKHEIVAKKLAGMARQFQEGSFSFWQL